MQISEIKTKMEELFPPIANQEWDPIGFVTFFDNSEIKKVLVVLDITRDAVDFAIKNNINLIISHHPFIFAKTYKEEWTKALYKKGLYRKLRFYKINVLIIHTNFDGFSRGTGYQILNKIGFDTTQSNISKMDEFNYIINSQIYFKHLLNVLEKNFLISNFRLNHKPRIKYKKIAVLPGSGGIVAIHNALEQNCDLIITSDLKWSDWLAVNEHQKNVTLLEIPHLIEQVFIEEISNILKDVFNLKVFSFYLKEQYFNYEIFKK